jgi:hypothetical protein
VTARLGELEPAVGRLETTGGADGAQLLVDGEALGKLPLGPVPVAPGEHHLTAVLPGRETFRARFVAVAGQRVTVPLAGLAPPPAEVAAAEASAPGPGLMRRWWFWTAVGVVAAGAAVGAALATGGETPGDGELGRSSTAEWTRP